MLNGRTILSMLFGDKGPQEIVVTRTSTSAILRLPNQWHPVGQTRLWLPLVFPVGPLIIFMTFYGTFAYPEDEQDRAGMWTLAGATLLTMVGRFYRWRVVWHYELHMTATTIQTVCHSTLYRRREAEIALKPILQFTAVRCKKDSMLQAESKDGEPQLIVRDADHERIVRLALKLVAERERLDPRLMTLVAAESTERGVIHERTEQPLHSKIVLSHNESGITLDFPLRDDGRLVARQRAWTLFQVGMFLLVGAVLFAAACSMLQAADHTWLSAFAFYAGIVLLVIAANKGVKSWTDASFDDDLCQLAIAGNLLIRTVRDHRKQIWYRQEIDSISLQDGIQQIVSNGEGGPSVIAEIYHLRLNMRLRDENITLVHWQADYPPDDYRPKAELEWLATVLRLALWPTNEIPVDRTQPSPSGTAIVAAAGPIDPRPADTRITS